MSTCPTCPCRAVLPGPGEDLLLGSAAPHVLAEVARQAARFGVATSPVAGAGLLRLSGARLRDLLAGLGGELTAQELDIVRAMPAVAGDAAGPGAAVAAALTAPTLGVLAALAAPSRATAALRAGDHYAVYQPIVDLRTSAVVGFESLLRGRVGGTEVVGGELFAAAEATGQLPQLDALGRELAICDAAAWLGERDLFVNFNPTSVYRPSVCLATTERALRRSGLNRRQLVFEVVESHAVDDPAHLLDVLDAYRAMGCRVAMDDVGAGYASLNLVARVQPDVVKIDRDLVHGIDGRAASAVIRAVVAFAHEFGAVVVAEGIETPGQLEAAQELGIDLGQGWLLGRPLPPTVAAALPAAA